MTSATRLYRSIYGAVKAARNDHPEIQLTGSEWRRLANAIAKRAAHNIAGQFTITYGRPPGRSREGQTADGELFNPYASADGSLAPGAQGAAEGATAAPTCRRCGGEMKPGVALAQTLTGGSPDLGGDVMTFSPGGPGKLVDCLKCAECGHSMTTETNE